MALQWTQSDLDFLMTSYSAIFQQEAAANVDSIWQDFATRVGSSGRTNMYGWLGEHPQFREFVDERKIQEVTGSTYELKNKKYESTIALQEDDVNDNNIDSYEVRVRAMGEAARQHRDELVCAALAAGHQQLCYDGQYFFDTDHDVNGSSVSNTQTSGSAEPWFLLDCRSSLKPLLMQVREEYSFKALDDTERAFMRGEILMGAKGRSVAGYGMWRKAYRSVATLDETGFVAARTAMRAFKTDKGRPAGVNPSHIVVSTANQTAAEKLFAVDFLTGGATNHLKGAVKIIVAPWL